MGYKGFFIDDEANNPFSELLSSSPESLSIDFLSIDEVATLADAIFEKMPDIVALDFRLDEHPGNLSTSQTYNGSGLAQLLRDKTSNSPERDFPIVLVSNEEKLSTSYQRDITSHDLFDRIYKKEQISKTPKDVIQELVALCEGYKNLKENRAHSKELLPTLGLDEEEAQQVTNQELRSQLRPGLPPHVIAKAILNQIIDRPGILLSDDDVCARLGVKSIEPLVDVLHGSNLAYQGVFHTGWRRWWTHRLDEFTLELFNARATTLTGSQRAEIIQRDLQIEVEAAQSTWWDNASSNEKFAFACACCRLPSPIRHSLSIFDLNASKYSAPRRVCWDCVATDKYKESHLEIDEVDSNLITEIQKRPRTEE